jgi:hypothetical protein
MNSSSYQNKDTRSSPSAIAGNMGRRLLPAVRDLTRDGRWSTYDVSVRKKMGGICAETGYPLKLSSPPNLAGWVIFLQLARRGALPARCSVLSHVISLAGHWAMGISGLFRDWLPLVSFSNTWPNTVAPSGEIYCISLYLNIKKYFYMQDTSHTSCQFIYLLN